jgi:hypothetical protein
MAAPADPTLDALERGPLHRFADFPDPGGGVDAISSAEPTLYMDDFIAAVVRERFSFRIAVAPDYATALATEAAIKAGGLAAGSPRLNPAQYRRRTQKRVGFTAR